MTLRSVAAVAALVILACDIGARAQCLDQSTYEQIKRRPWLGVSLANVTADFASGVGLPDTMGAKIVDVARAGPAADAGIKPDDVILEIGSESVVDARALTELLGRSATDVAVNLRLHSINTTSTVAVTLRLRPAPQSAYFGLQSSIVGLAQSRDGSKVAIAAQSGLVIRTWEPGSSEPGLILQGHTRRIRAVDISADGSVVASASRDGTLRAWDAKTGMLMFAVIAHDGEELLDVKLSSNGRLAVTSGADRVIRLWDLSTKTLVRSLFGHVGHPTALSLSHDNARIVSASPSGEVFVWSFHGEVLSRQKVGDSRHSVALAWDSHADKLIVARSSGSSSVFDTKADRLLFQFEADASAAAIVPGKSVTLFSVPDGGVEGLEFASRLRRFGKRQEIQAGALKSVDAISISRDGRWMLTGGSDCVVRRWDLSAVGGHQQ